MTKTYFWYRCNILIVIFIHVSLPVTLLIHHFGPLYHSDNVHLIILQTSEARKKKREAKAVKKELQLAGRALIKVRRIISKCNIIFNSYRCPVILQFSQKKAIIIYLYICNCHYKLFSITYQISLIGSKSSIDKSVGRGKDAK